MADLLISRVAPGVSLVKSVDPFDTLEIHRIDRSRWEHTPEKPGVYLLYGVASEGKLTVYVGMSETNMRNRVRKHHVTPNKNWFGTLFAVPVASALLCPAIEAELIWQLTEANIVDVIANIAQESRHRGADDVHVEPAVEKVRDGLQLVLGSDIFTASESGETGGNTDPPLGRLPPLARAYRGGAEHPRPRTVDDPDEATHAYVGAGAEAWGRFEAAEPDKRFQVFAGSGWRRPVLNPENTTYDRNLKVNEMQDRLIEAAVLDEATMSFKTDHVFDNWNLATQAVSGKAQYSGAYHWQLLEGDAG